MNSKHKWLETTLSIYLSWKADINKEISQQIMCEVQCNLDYPDFLGPIKRVRIIKVRVIKVALYTINATWHFLHRVLCPYKFRDFHRVIESKQHLHFNRNDVLSHAGGPNSAKQLD